MLEQVHASVLGMVGRPVKYWHLATQAAVV